jgi:hypothetical protein
VRHLQILSRERKSYHHSESWDEIVFPRLGFLEELNFKFLNVDFDEDDDKVKHLSQLRRR